MFNGALPTGNGLPFLHNGAVQTRNGLTKITKRSIYKVFLFYKFINKLIISFLLSVYNFPLYFFSLKNKHYDGYQK